MCSSSRALIGCREARHELDHPDEEAVAADDDDREHRRHDHGQEQEAAQLLGLGDRFPVFHTSVVRSCTRIEAACRGGQSRSNVSRVPRHRLPSWNGAELDQSAIDRAGAQNRWTGDGLPLPRRSSGPNCRSLGGAGVIHIASAGAALRSGPRHRTPHLTPDRAGQVAASGRPAQDWDRRRFDVPTGRRTCRLRDGVTTERDCAACPRRPHSRS